MPLRMEFELLSETIAGGMNPNGLSVPFPRSGHRILATKRYVYVIGGFNPALWTEDNDASTSYPMLREVWRYDVFTHDWQRIKVDGEIPYEMASHAAILDGCRALIFGGSGVPFGQKNSGNLHALNLRTFKWTTLFDSSKYPSDDRPSAGYGQGIALHDRMLYIVGGTCGHTYNCDVHSLDLHQSTRSSPKWTLHKRPDRSGLERYRHECVYYENRLILFGGGTSAEARSLRTLDVLDIKTQRWIIQNTYPDMEYGFPLPRRCLGLARYGDSVYISGGCFDDVIYDDLWHYDLKSNRWSKLHFAMPQPLYFHGFTISENGCMYLFGGITIGGVRNSTLYRCWLTVPSLQQICMENLIKHADKQGKSKPDWLKSVFEHCFAGQSPFGQF